MISRVNPVLAGWALVAVSLICLPLARGEDCQTSSDMDEATRAALTGAGQRYFGMIAKGDAASLKMNSIPSVASDFSGIETAIKDNQANLSGAQATQVRFNPGMSARCTLVL